MYDRVSTFLETLYRDMEKGGCGDNAIMISHGLFCRFFLMRFFHWKVLSFKDVIVLKYTTLSRLKNFINSGILRTVNMQ